jgi:hypothetical protein
MMDELISTDSIGTRVANASMACHRSSAQTIKLGCNAREDSRRLHDDGRAYINHGLDRDPMGEHGGVSRVSETWNQRTCWVLRQSGSHLGGLWG